MKLYHSSTVVVKNPDINHSRDFLDFGRGFYLTTIREQAINYAQRFARRKQEAYLNVYNFIDDLSEWKVKTFDAYNSEWLDFVVRCRSGKETNNYDLVIGGIANDKVILTLDLFFSGTISADDALGRLAYEKPNIQYCIRSQQLIDQCLTYIESTKI
jgi:hypothetical protein